MRHTLFLAFIAVGGCTHGDRCDSAHSCNAGDFCEVGFCKSGVAGEGEGGVRCESPFSLKADGRCAVATPTCDAGGICTMDCTRGRETENLNPGTCPSPPFVDCEQSLNHGKVFVCSTAGASQG